MPCNAAQTSQAMHVSSFGYDRGPTMHQGLRNGSPPISPDVAPFVRALDSCSTKRYATHTLLSPCSIRERSLTALREGRKSTCAYTLAVRPRAGRSVRRISLGISVHITSATTSASGAKSSDAVVAKAAVANPSRVRGWTITKNTCGKFTSATSLRAIRSGEATDAECNIHPPLWRSQAHSFLVIEC